MMLAIAIPEKLTKNMFTEAKMLGIAPDIILIAHGIGSGGYTKYDIMLNPDS